MKPAILRGGLSIPIGVADERTIRKDLTLRYAPMGEEPREIEAFFMDDAYITVPRQYGLSYCDSRGIEVIDETSQGVAVEFPRIPTPRPEQVEFIDKLEESTGEFYDFIAKAHTGFGKTVCALILAARLGRAALIVVDQDNLKEQWKKRLMDPNLFGLREDQIGVIQGPECRYEGCLVVIAMVHTLSQKDIPQEALDYCGVAIFDEVHTIGAPTFSFVLFSVASAYRFGVSATPKRRDGLQKGLTAHLGQIAVSADAEHEESNVCFAYHDTVYSWYANISPKTGRFVSEVAEDGSRNLMAATIIKDMYDEGRDILVIGERIEHLKHVRSLCYYLGIDEADMGMYTGYDSVFGVGKEAKPARRPKDIVKHAETGSYEYCPVSLQLIAKRVLRKRLDEIEQNCRIIFATYGKFSKGADVPRLSAGLDITPRSTSEQTQGRILRKQKGKMTPLWVTLVDENSYRSLFMWAQRIKDYLKSNSRIHEWEPTGGIKAWLPEELSGQLWRRIEMLKECRIELHRDGHNMLVTPKAALANKRQAVMDTVANIRNRHQSLREASSLPDKSARSSSVTRNPPPPSRLTRSRKPPSR